MMSCFFKVAIKWQKNTTLGEIQIYKQIIVVMTKVCKGEPRQENLQNFTVSLAWFLKEKTRLTPNITFNLINITFKH